MKNIILLFFLIACGGLIFAQEDTTRITKPGETNILQLREELKNKPFHTEGFNRENFSVFPEDFTGKNKKTFSGKVTSFKKSPYAPFVLPVAFISYGVATRLTSSLRTLDKEMHGEVSEYFPGHWRVDDYTQYAPAVAVYGLQLTGLQPKNSFRDRTFVMVTSHLIMAGTVNGLKHSIKVERPNGRNRKSFPSGHTATAFTGAQVLFHEYKDTSPWIAVGGYAAAGFTGAMRMVNKCHWLSDVVAGAGIGILSVEIAYLLLPVFQKAGGRGTTNKNLVVIPTVGVDYYGAGMAYTF